MGRIRYDTATTLNGWIADEHNSLSWLFAVPGSTDAEHEIATPDAAAIAMGSTTYQWMLDENALLEHPEKWQEFFGTTPVFVFTTRELAVPADADIRFVRGAVAEVLPLLRAEAGEGDIWVIGGGELAGQFLDAGALDEIALTIAPVALATGAPLFPRRVESDRLRLGEVRQVGQFARLVYEVH